jgi:hypothetical protein
MAGLVSTENLFLIFETRFGNIRKAGYYISIIKGINQTGDGVKKMLNSPEIAFGTKYYLNFN